MNETLFLIINSWVGQSTWLDGLMIFFAQWLGYLIIAGLVLYFLHDRIKNQPMFLTALVSAIISRFVFVELIRFFYYHPRPFMVLENINVLVNHGAKSSFPSGHAAFYFALAGGVFVYNKKLGWWYFALTGLMGLARIFVGIHWPFDIFVGALIGVTIGYLVNAVKNKYFSIFPSS